VLSRECVLENLREKTEALEAIIKEIKDSLDSKFLGIDGADEMSCNMQAMLPCVDNVWRFINDDSKTVEEIEGMNVVMNVLLAQLRFMADELGIKLSR